ncbi:hypothetical protein ACFL6M_02020 [Candidatus Eisenbacteria bacterium]|uniref:Integrase n=1 Tax=Eiseniibacteriota bacterium TaxID=2212470 RepID=A0ABV6YJ36_UNCEI
MFIIRQARRNILHVGITPDPTAEWICQRLREAFPDDQVPRYLIFDRDGKFGHEVIRTLKRMGVEIVRPTKVIALPRIGGLHHRYEWQAAA